MVGTEETRLVMVRGNSGSGKSSVAASMRKRFGCGLALVSQDNLRCVVLCENDRPGVANIGLIDVVARYALTAGYHTVLEGVLYAEHCSDILAQLRADHRGMSHSYYLDTPFEEPDLAHISEAQLRSWYREHDLLPRAMETVIGADSTLAETIDRIMRDTGLADLTAPE
ncbi:kinase [Streptomyces lydicus]|uniref:kinase n=1 Tax=Streptomyces lydicus TaxID=47763 RepID=UPI0037A056D3